MHTLDTNNTEIIKREINRGVEIFRELFGQLGIDVDDATILKAYKDFILRYYNNDNDIVLDLGSEELVFNLLHDDFSLSNIFGYRRNRNCYFACKNSKGQQALIKFNMEDGYDCNTGTEIFDAEVLLPFEEREFEEVTLYSVITKNKNNNKYGEYNFIKGFVIEEKYDLITVKEQDRIITLDGKQGRISSNKMFNIPPRYDELFEASFSLFNKNYSHSFSLDDDIENQNDLLNMSCPCPTKYVVLTKKGNLVGAYCYITDFHMRYDVNEDRGWKHRFIKKRLIPPVFDDVKVVNVDKERAEITLEVSLNGKVGILEAYRKTFIVPIIFDSIISYEYILNRDIYEFVLNCYGLIDGVEYFYDGKTLTKIEPIAPKLTLDFLAVKNKIEKKI